MRRKRLLTRATVCPSRSAAPASEAGAVAAAAFRDAMIGQYLADTIRSPTVVEIVEQLAWLSEWCGLSCVIGAVDGCHILIYALLISAQDQRSFCSRKGAHHPERMLATLDLWYVLDERPAFCAKLCAPCKAAQHLK